MLPGTDMAAVCYTQVACYNRLIGVAKAGFCAQLFSSIVVSLRLLNTWQYCMCNEDAKGDQYIRYHMLVPSLEVIARQDLMQ